MKTLKSLAMIALATLFAFNVQAAEKKSNAKTQQTQTNQNSDLKKFNDAVQITPKTRQIGQTQQKQPVLILSYEIANKGKQAIKSLKWIGAYGYQKDIFFQLDVPVTLEKPLRPRSKTVITISIPMDLLPEPAKQIFADFQKPIEVFSIARNITFSNGSQINVKD